MFCDQKRVCWLGILRTSRGKLTWDALLTFPHLSVTEPMEPTLLQPRLSIIHCHTGFSGRD